MDWPGCEQGTPRWEAGDMVRPTLWCLVYETHITVKQRYLSRDQTMHSLEHALSCWHRPLSSQMIEVLPQMFGNSARYWAKCSFISPHVEKSIWRRSGHRGGHVIGPRRPVHLQEYVAFNHCRTWSPAVLKRQPLWLTASSSPGRTVSRSRCWAVSLSGSWQRPLQRHPKRWTQYCKFSRIGSVLVSFIDNC
jgi:hypothetical protein